MPLTLEQTARLEYLRGRAIRGEATREEELEGIEILRGDRIAAQVASTKARTAKAEAAKPVDTKALLAGLMGSTFTKGETTKPPAPPPEALPQGTLKL